MFLAALTIFLCVCSCSLQNELSRFPRQPMPPMRPRPGPMDPPPPPMRPGRPPPPVDVNFSSSCEKQRERSRHIDCEEDGSFAAVQCMGPRCFCVDKQTGERINAETFSKMMRESVNCTALSRCPTMRCAKICRDGYQQDSDKCQLCECNEPPMPQSCDTVQEIVEDEGCSCECVGETAIPSNAGPRTRMRRMCLSCNSTCNNLVQSRNTSCVVTEEDCREGTTLKSTGPRGRTECVEDLNENDECEPEAENVLAGGLSPVPEGASRRDRVGKVGSSPPPCREGLVCKEQRYRKYFCTRENADGPCVVARANDSYLECDPEGFYKPVQCRPIPVTTTEDATTSIATSSATTGTVATESPPTTEELLITTTENLPAVTEDATTTTEQVQIVTTPPTPSRRSVRSVPRQPRSVGKSRGSRGGPMLCQCVEPTGGTVVMGSEVTVTGRQKGPDCRRVLRECRVPGVDMRGRGPSNFRVAHGQDYFDAANCRTCQCSNGNATYLCSSPGNCSTVPTERVERNCSVEGGEEVPHGHTMQVGCEMCGCRHGKLHCTKKRRGCMGPPSVTDRSPRPTSPSPSLEEGTCDGCKSRPLSPSCGPDGRNHRSICTAVQCAGIPAVDMKEGPCQSQDACEEHPCPRDMLCINKQGTVACIGPRGCSPHHLRTCVDVNKLSCPVVEESETTPSPEEPSEFNPESTDVCGSDGMTYSSLCHLIQISSNVRVSHAGSCDSSECQTGEVCGSDGLTYSNLCELQNQAAVRADYPGSCVANANNSLEALCQEVISEGRCSVNEENCNNVVFPEDGCCPICGGSVQIVVDIDAIEDASETNSDLKVVDLFTLDLLEAEVLANISGRCSIAVGLTETGSVQIVFNAINDGNDEFCFQISKRVESFINDGVETMSGEVNTNEVQVALPQTFSFAIVSSAAEPVEGGEPMIDSTTEGGTNVASTNAAVRLHGTHFFILLGVTVVSLFRGNIIMN